jgi:hypothetical protein
VIGVRRLVAILCLAAILVLAWNPASFGVLCAVLLPVGVWIGFVSSYSVRVRPVTPRPRYLPGLALIPPRAPPIL